MAQRSKKQEEEPDDAGTTHLVLSDNEIMLQSQVDELREIVGQLTISLTKLAELNEVQGNDFGRRLSIIESIPILQSHIRTASAT